MTKQISPIEAARMLRVARVQVGEDFMALWLPEDWVITFSFTGAGRCRIEKLSMEEADRLLADD